MFCKKIVCILIGRAFRDEGYKVKYIVTNGDMITQEEIDKRLIDYYPNRRQLSFLNVLI